MKGVDMASLYRRGEIYWIKYARGGNTIRESTKCTKKYEADLVKKKFEGIELNTHNAMSIRQVNEGLFTALDIFRDKITLIGNRGNKETSSIKREQANINTFKAYLVSKSINDFRHITPDIIQDYIWTYCAVTQNKKPNSIIKEKRTVHKFFRWAIKQHYIYSNPADDIKTPKPLQQPPRYFSQDELTKIFNGAKQPYKDIFSLLYLTGLRIGELLHLEWRDYNKEKKEIVIRVMSGNKTKRETRVPLNKQAVKLLDAQDRTNSSLIFHTSNNTGFETDKIRVYLMRLLKKLNINGATTHTFRHTCASHLVQMGVSLYVVRDILRHKSIRETEIYAHLADDTTRKAVDLLTI
jgi:integrase/recombinase XerD